MHKNQALDLALKTLEALKAAYRIGFQSSGEGYNGEYPFNFENPEVDSDWCISRDEKMKMVAKYAQKEIELYTTPPAAQPAPVQEVVAWTWDTAGVGTRAGHYEAHFQLSKPKKTATMLNLTPLYTTPPAQHEFVGLTDVEVLHLEIAPFMTIREVYAVIEAKLKEKNNGHR